MSASENLLIVEDDRDWCEIYSGVAAKEGFTTVKIAKDLDAATSLIDDLRFAVAFIDVGLNVGEDQNVDGLRVMSKIRAMGDPTSIVVVTGRSGRDVLPVTRDSIVKYQAHEIVGKTEIAPQDLRNLLRTGQEAFVVNTADDPTAREFLRGDVPEMAWDDQMLSGTGVRDGVKGLYDFLDRLMAGLLPVVKRQPDGAVTADPATGVMHGSYWSRSIGQAIAVCFGDTEPALREIETARSGRSLLGRYDVGVLLQDSQAYGLSGGVFELRNAPRDSFRDS